jgi:Fe-S oxidoreductase
MTLAEYRSDMETCCRCSACKFIPLEKAKGASNINVCPSIARYNFHAYSGGGRLGIGVALLEKEIQYSDKLLEVVYNCQLCGACDVSCKYAMDMEVLDPINETRIDCVEKGKTLPVLDRLIERLRTKGTMAGRTKGGWSEGLEVKNYTQHKTDVIYHAGCRTAGDRSMWSIARSTVALLHKAGIDVGIAGEQEPCCGGRAYSMGYKADFCNQAKNNMKLIRKSGAKTMVTSCAECYYAFKVLYDKFGLKGDLEVLHTSEYIARLMHEGKLEPRKKVDLKVTYHDPCHLGRLGEPYIHWQGKQVPGQIRIFDPPKEFRRGTYGVYGPPRDILSSIPGIKLVEMERTKEYAWCCGAGGGVAESNPGFARWTAEERIKEAGLTGAEAIVTACPGCEKLFRGAIKSHNSSMKIYDIMDIMQKATL